MIRFAATNEIGIPFEKAEGLRCVGSNGSQELALRMASYEMKPKFQALGAAIGKPDVGAYVLMEETQKQYGAICLFFCGVLEFIHEQLGDFYALPSSIHEWIILPKHREDLDALRAMVRGVNLTLDPKDKLSDDVYEYVNGAFRIAR